MMCTQMKSGHLIRARLFACLPVRSIVPQTAAPRKGHFTPLMQRPLAAFSLSCYNATVSHILPAQDAVYRLLSLAWDPQGLPDAASIPWDDVVPIVIPSNVAPVVYTVTRPLRDALPAPVGDLLQQAFYRAAAANVRLMDQLVQVQRVLAAFVERPAVQRGLAVPGPH